MLLPFQWSVLTLDEARTLMKFIEESTATKGQSRNYDKMQKAGVLEVYNSIRTFVEKADHWSGNLEYFNPDDYAREDHDHGGQHAYH